VLRVFFSPAYVGAAHDFATTRKAAWIAAALVRSPLPGIELVEPASLSEDEVVRVHDAAYVRAVREGIPRPLAESQGFGWDEGLWRMATASNGGAVAAAEHAMRHGVAGSLSSGLHHARRERGGGFCTFNGLVLGALAALDAGARHVLILDLDAHCGGGTASLIRAEPRIWQWDVSVSPVDWYERAPRARLTVARRADDYLRAIRMALGEAERDAPPFGLCLYNAGMDAHERCDIGGLPGITRDLLAARERLVFEWCRARGLPVAFVLAGGYPGPRLGEDEIVDLHLLTLSAAAAAEAAGSAARTTR
jgi:acetoin utilization deacetylase AcuC-like enzyme